MAERLWDEEERDLAGERGVICNPEHYCHMLHTTGLQFDSNKRTTLAVQGRKSSADARCGGRQYKLKTNTEPQQVNKPVPYLEKA